MDLKSADDPFRERERYETSSPLVLNKERGGNLTITRTMVHGR